jgi:hypothetical protein
VLLTPITTVMLSGKYPGAEAGLVPAPFGIVTITLGWALAGGMAALIPRTMTTASAPAARETICAVL